MQTDSKFALIFLSFDIYSTRKRVEKMEKCNYIYKLFNVLRASDSLVACILTI